MIDLKKFRQNPEIYKQGAIKKGYGNFPFDKFTELDKELLQKKKTIEELTAKKNSLANNNKSNDPAIIEELKTIKNQAKILEEEYNTLYPEFHNLYLTLPNPPLEDVPFGKDDSENQTIGLVNEKPTFDFTPVDHAEILKNRGFLDAERGTKVSGSRFYYLKDGIVKLQFALQQFVFQKLCEKGFTPVLGPNLVRESAMTATGFFPADKNEIYTVNPDEDNLFLIGTSEVTLVAQHADETFDGADLPIRYFSFSPCYRREAGSYGKDTKGLIRVHQFDKIEMVIFCKPEDSTTEHQKIFEIEQEIFTELGIHFRKIAICTGDSGPVAAKKYDIEAWMPGQNAYREVTSCSNCTDYQARRANIRYKDSDTKDFAHTLNGTALSITRFLAVFVENYQTQDQKITIPTVLQPYMGGVKEI